MPRRMLFSAECRGRLAPLAALLAAASLTARPATAADAPEHDQPWGKAARRALSDLVYRKSVEIEPITQDQYERMVARVWLGERSVDAELVAGGNAWVYRRYANEASYCVDEREAREARRGLWSLPQEQWIAPWEWRHRARTGQPFTDYSTQTVVQCVKSLGK